MKAERCNGVCAAVDAPLNSFINQDIASEVSA